MPPTQDLAKKEEEIEGMRVDMSLMQKALARPVERIPLHEPESKVQITASLTQHGVQVRAFLTGMELPRG